MLTGEFNHSIDAKGRLIIPSKFREILGEDFVITKGLDGCLFLYPANEWKIFEEKLYLIQSDQPAISAPAIHTDELDPSLELFLSWDDNYQIWHDRWLSSASRPHIAADTITLLDRLWKKPGNWMVAPQSVILELSHYRPLFISELKNTPPNRVCYKIKHKYPKSTSKRAVEFFENALEDFLAESTPSFPIGQVWERQK